MNDDFLCGPWIVRPSLNRIERNGNTVPLEPKVMDVLVFLAERKGMVTTREELLDRVWGHRHLSDSTLSRCVFELRKALGEDHRRPEILETIRKKGYRLIASVESLSTPPPTSSVPHPFESSYSRIGISFAAGLSLAIVLLLGWQDHSRPDSSPDLIRPVPVTSFAGSELDPALSPDETRVAFSWNGPEGINYDIYVREVEGGTAKRLTETPGEEKNPTWSPDGSRIAFVRSSGERSGIYEIPVGGGEERRLIETRSGDIPDLLYGREGRSLLYVDRPRSSAPFSLFEYDLLNRRRRQVTEPHETSYGDRDLALSPDGNRVAVARAERLGIEDLYVISLDATLDPSLRERRVTSDRCSITGLEWTPDGEEILVSSNRIEAPRLWRVPTDGGAPRPIRGFGKYASDPFLSPRSGRLLYERRTAVVNIWASRRENPSRPWSPPHPLITSTRWDFSPRFSPCGTRIAFFSDRSGPNEVWIANREGTETQRLTDFGGPILEAIAWSPNGESLLISHRGPDQKTDLSILCLETRSTQRLTNTPWNENTPTYSADGQWIYFASDRQAGWQLWRMDIDGGRAERLTRKGGLGALESREGRILLLRRPGTEGLVGRPLPEGSEFRFPSCPTPKRTLDFGLGANHLYFITSREEPGREGISIYGMETDEIEKPSSLSWTFSGLPSFGVCISPDETTLLFTRFGQIDSDIMLVEGFH